MLVRSTQTNRKRNFFFFPHKCTMAPSKSKSNRENGRGSKKSEEELLELCSAMKLEIHLVHEQMSKLHEKMKKQRQKMKKQRQKDRQKNCYLISLITEVHQFFMKDQGGSISLQSKASSSAQRKLELSFVCALPDRLYTASKIYAVDDSTSTNVPMRIVLLNESREVVTDGPLSSVEIEILVVYGDFKAEEPEMEWTSKEVETRQVRARQEKGSLLVGSCSETMESGVCSFNDLKFVDNSSWVPCGKFKLVAKVVKTAQVPEMVEIMPAFSRPFRVVEGRGKQFEKQSIPSWDSEVWRLKKIKRNGTYHKKLIEKGIKTVMDFRQRYTLDESSLREILGAKEGVWAAIVEHANECYPNNDLLFRYDIREEGVELLFDCFYILIGVSFDRQNGRSLEGLSKNETSLVERIRRRAIEDHSKLVEINSVSCWPSAITNSWIPPPPPLKLDGNATLNEPEPQLLQFFRYESKEDELELLFDSLCELKGISLDHQNEINFEDLSESNRILVQRHSKLAFDNFNDLIPINLDSEWPSAKTSPWIPPHQGSTTLNRHPSSSDTFPSYSSLLNTDVQVPEEPTDDVDYSPLWIDCHDDNNQL